MNTKVTDISGPDALLCEYDLVGERKQEPHYYEIQTKLATQMALSQITNTTMWRIPVDKSIPCTRLTIRAIGKDEFD